MPATRVSCISANNSKAATRAFYLTSKMFSHALQVMVDIMDGYKTFQELGILIDLDPSKPPQSARLQVKHTEIAEKLLNLFEDHIFYSQQVKDKIKYDSPIIQSGGHYKLDINHENDENYLKDNVIIFCWSLKYKKYSSTIMRTLIKPPTRSHEVVRNYNFLLLVQKFVIEQLRDGVILGELYQKAINFVNEKRPDLTKHLTDNFGSVIKIKPTEQNFAIVAKSEEIAKENMIFNINIGMHSIIDCELMPEPPHTYALWFGDDVTVNKDAPATICSRSINNLILDQKRVLF